jgi:Protein of unknown function (DUF732)
MMSTRTLLVALAAAWAICAAVPATADTGDVQPLQPSRPSTATLDDQFLADIARAGMRVADLRTAIAGAHETCAYLADHHTAMEAVEQGQRVNPTMTKTNEIDYVDAAISVFCPRYLQISGTLA